MKLLLSLLLLIPTNLLATTVTIDYRLAASICKSESSGDNSTISCTNELTPKKEVVLRLSQDSWECSWNEDLNVKSTYGACHIDDLKVLGLASRRSAFAQRRQALITELFD